MLELLGLSALGLLINAAVSHKQAERALATRQAAIKAPVPFTPPAQPLTSPRPYLGPRRQRSPDFYAGRRAMKAARKLF